jgi:mono/diheme cytochrome c family protein
MYRAILTIAVLGMMILISCRGKAKSNEKGKALYVTYCQGCHMDDGKGVPHMNAPLTGSSYVTGDKEKLVQIVLEGSAAFRNDPTRSYKNVMGPIPGLTDEQIADILSYVRVSFGNTSTSVTPQEVKLAREKINK